MPHSPRLLRPRRPTTAAAPGPTEYTNWITATVADVQMGSITNNSGRAVTSNATINQLGILSPGSHGNNDEYTLGLEFNSQIPPQGNIIALATLTLWWASTYDAAPGVIKLYISAHDADTPAATNTTTGDLRASIRPRTTATTIVTVTSVVQGDGNELDIDIAPVIQELVDRAGWTGTRIVILIDTHADTTTGEWQDVSSFDDAGPGAGAPPRLVIQA